MHLLDERHSVDPVYIETVVDFIRTYADRCHHGKEEDVLFRELASKPLSEPVASMMQELIDDHVFARGKTRELVEANTRYEAGDSSAVDEIAKVGWVLVDFYPRHIWKEDRQFWKPALEYFDDAEKERLVAEFDEFDRQLIHEKYLGVVERLERWES
jgi:hemerythrin-like domain-containing protein